MEDIDDFNKTVELCSDRENLTREGRAESGVDGEEMSSCESPIALKKGSKDSSSLE